MQKPCSRVAFTFAGPETQGSPRVPQLLLLMKPTRDHCLCSMPTVIYDGSHSPVSHTQRPRSWCQDTCKAEMIAWQWLEACGLGTKERKVSRRSLSKPWESSVSRLGPLPEVPPPALGLRLSNVSGLCPPAQDEFGPTL